MSEPIEKESFALFGQFAMFEVQSDLLLAVFDSEEAADEAARGIVADPVMLLKHAFPGVCQFWFKPREVNPEPTESDWEAWAEGLMSLHIVRMVGRDSMRVVHSVVQQYFLEGDV